MTETATSCDWCRQDGCTPDNEASCPCPHHSMTEPAALYVIKNDQPDHQPIDFSPVVSEILHQHTEANRDD